MIQMKKCKQIDYNKNFLVIRKHNTFPHANKIYKLRNTFFFDSHQNSLNLICYILSFDNEVIINLKNVIKTTEIYI